MVQSVKKVLGQLLSTTKQTPTDETLHTFLTEAENVVNGRPLTDLSVDPDDPLPLTPNHFLLGWTNGSRMLEQNQPVLGDFGDKDYRCSWKSAQRLADEFWSRWVREYLPTLTRRAKWLEEGNQLEVGDVVVIVDDQAPRNKWKLGRVVSVFPGKDGRIRSAEVRTATGTYRRPTVKLAPLDVKREEKEERAMPRPAPPFRGKYVETPPTGGGTSSGGAIGDLRGVPGRACGHHQPVARVGHRGFALPQ
jgi:hypothetical protein